VVVVVLHFEINDLSVGTISLYGMVRDVSNVNVHEHPPLLFLPSTSSLGSWKRPIQFLNPANPHPSLHIHFSCQIPKFFTIRPFFPFQKVSDEPPFPLVCVCRAEVDLLPGMLDWILNPPPPSSTRNFCVLNYYYWSLELFTNKNFIFNFWILDWFIMRETRERKRRRALSPPSFLLPACPLTFWQE